MTTKSKALLTFMLILGAGILPIALYSLRASADLQVPPLAALPVHSLPPYQQAAQALAGLFIKPLYMLLSLVIIVVLVGQPGADISALKWGQVAFLSGEIFCAVNFYIYRHASVLSEYLHSYGMALAFGFTFFALFESLDSRLLRLSNSETPCAALALCGKCTRHQDEGCKVHSVAQFLMPLLAGLIFIPILSPLQPDSYAVSIFRFPYSYMRLSFYEAYERRILPLFALTSFAIAYVPLLVRRNPPLPLLTKAFTAAGLGALGFSFFRLVLNAIFADNLVWFEFWEETTELMYIGFILFTLWQFRRTLLPRRGILGRFIIRFS